MNFKYVCSNCVDEISIHEFIQNNGYEDHCDYCGKRGKKISIDFEMFQEKILQSLEQEYVDAADFLFSSDDYGWDRTITAYEMFIEDEAELGISNDELKQDLWNFFSDKQWFREGIYLPSFSDTLNMSWNHFSEIIKYKWRYTFFMSENNEYEPSSMNPISILKYIMAELEDEDLISELPINTELYRARFHLKSETINAKTLGTAPPQYVKSANRFSPIGISMFYASLDNDTCLDEIMQSKGRKKYYSIGTFRNTKEIPILDLSSKLTIPGYYSDGNFKIESRKFINHFMKLISTKTSTNDEYLEYIPTQVFTEFLRQSKSKERVKGIKYMSSRNKKDNIVLFYNNDKCVDFSSDDDDVLELVSSTTKKI